MNLKKYQGNSMAEALEKVKADLGNKAVILNTRTISRKRIWGMGGRTLVEITAGGGVDVLSQGGSQDIITGFNRADGSARHKNDMDSRSLPTLHAEGAAMRPTAGSITESSNRTSSSGLSALHDEIGELRAMVRELINRPALVGPCEPAVPQIPEELSHYYTAMIQHAVADEIARRIIETAKNRLAKCRQRLVTHGLVQQIPDKREKQIMADLVQAVIIESIEKMLPVPEAVPVQTGNSPRFLAMVGPTGVGKTTTIAKLAAQFKLREKKRVGMITIDTYRIAAVDQLKTYADILGVPLEMAMTVEQMQEALERMADYDVVLIDTSGRSQNDTKRLHELKTFLDIVRNSSSTFDYCVSDIDGPDPGSASRMRINQTIAGESLEIHLVLSCTAHPQQLSEVADKFGVLGINRVVFTKLDEAVGLGVILNMIGRTNLQLSYLTTGQDVPDDIQVGNLRRIAEMILNESTDSCPAEPRDMATDYPRASLEDDK
ncbi:MAG: flagellar biosynthesis protein FlhF [Planctomycetota bacterium]|jgi:flagellar biosynthesis protein FlhF